MSSLFWDTKSGKRRTTVAGPSGFPDQELDTMASALEAAQKLCPGLMFAQAPNGSFLFVGDGIGEWTGVEAEELTADPDRFQKVIHEADWEEWKLGQRRVESGSVRGRLFRMRHVDTGRIVHVMERGRAISDERGVLLGFEGVWMDGTRQVVAERHLEAMSWKETLASLTMGLAHDFSNLLAGTISLVEAYQAGLPADHPFNEGFALIKKNSTHARSLVHRIANLNREVSGERSYLDINAEVRDGVELARKVAPSSVVIKTAICDGSAPIYVDPVEFRRVFFNLTVNAIDAVNGEGVLRFETEKGKGPVALEHSRGSVPTGAWVRFTVRDNGCGVSAGALESIFEPFFTTKPLSKGTGLGLYNASVFAEQSGGAISVASSKGEGAALSLWFPESDFTEASVSARQRRPARRTLLLVASEAEVAGSGAEWLRERGYYVLMTEPVGTLTALDSPDYHFDAVVALIRPEDEWIDRTWTECEKRSPKMKRIVQIVAGDEEDVPRNWLARAHLVIGAGTPAVELMTRLRELLDQED